MDGLMVSHCKNQKKESYEIDGQYKMMVFSKNHNCQIALAPYLIQVKKKTLQAEYQLELRVILINKTNDLK